MSKVSIIVPVYNAEAGLGYCINSILNQTHRDLELILVNDGSYDNSLKICENYANVDSRVKIISISNQGVGNARNTGLDAATGEYIQFVDADDTINPEMTEELLNRVKTYQKDLVICDYNIVQLDGKKFIRSHNISLKLGLECVYDKDLFIDKFPYILWHNSILESPWNRIYRKSVFDNYNIRFPIDISLGEDFLMNMQYYQACNGVVIVDKKYYNYVQNNNQSLSKVYRTNMLDIQMRIINYLKQSLSLRAHWVDENIKLINNYIIGHVIICLENLFHSLCKLTEEQKRAEIAKIINDKQIRDSFNNFDYINPLYEEIVEYFSTCDVQNIYNLVKDINVTQADNFEVIKSQTIHPGRLNKILVNSLKFIIKLTKSRDIELLKSNLEQKGIKITIKKIINKL